MLETINKDKLKGFEYQGGGNYKRVLKSEIFDEKSGEIKKVIIKILRIFQKDSKVKINEEDLNDFKLEISGFTKLKEFFPQHVPQIYGELQLNNSIGIVVEEVEGQKLHIIEKNNLENKITKQQFARFKKMILELMDKDLYIDIDSLQTHNLILGKVSGSTEDEIVILEPLVRDQLSEDQKIPEKFLILSALTSLEDQITSP